VVLGLGLGFERGKLGMENLLSLDWFLYAEGK
jgi:hypothetical protein